ncbi:cytochrome c peroxidase [Nitratiruptor sp. YY08-26]|uniref:cytochrome-c peroxidase n=1 Tax=unclassified Nitratiruptor TaxID=2624044 RepID=UPI0019165A09|nr:MULTISPECIES: cytochrome c peroxidase [unclassified Nitratiruptor]BCD61797.1 cytochrome c peroxidase [Nitratiruptor sp. YY08-13]BCD65732.1 cytochrome c peroxidase [Nitratiruptor sp. YY08-26]
MKKVLIFIVLPLFIFSTPYIVGKMSTYIILKTSSQEISSQQLRKQAIAAGFRSNPKNFNDLMKLLDTPSNRLTKEKILLGKMLFFDPSLSRDGTISCASCHNLDSGGDDNRPTAIGYKNRKNPHHLNSPTVLNAALQKFQFWDGRAKSVEEQAKGPLQAPFEMAMTPKEVVERVRQNPSYRKMFKEVFGDETITIDRVTKAIGAYERTLLTRGRFDDFLDGNLSALNPKEQKGLKLFISIGCKACHMGRSIGGKIIQKFPIIERHTPIYPVFGFHEGKYYFKELRFDTNISYEPYPFPNFGHYYGKNSARYFKVPILRNITKTAPYFHNGAVKDLKEAIRIMGKYQRDLELNENQIDAIEAFFHTLEGKIVDYGI